MRSLDLFLILASVGLSALAQVLLKAGTAAARQGLTTTGTSVIDTYQALLSSPMTLAGLAAYAVGALLWLRVLAAVDLSQAYPFVAIGFAITAVAGIVVFGEPVIATRVLGTVLILTGVVLVAFR
jgi:multidrug transporter EmrE-like cation transporter